jgi:histone H3/H4
MLAAEVTPLLNSLVKQHLARVFAKAAGLLGDHKTITADIVDGALKMHDEKLGYLKIGNLPSSDFMSTLEHIAIFKVDEEDKGDKEASKLQEMKYYQENFAQLFIPLATGHRFMKEQLQLFLKEKRHTEVLKLQKEASKYLQWWMEMLILNTFIKAHFVMGILGAKTVNAKHVSMVLNIAGKRLNAFHYLDKISNFRDNTEEHSVIDPPLLEPKVPKSKAKEQVEKIVEIKEPEPKVTKPKEPEPKVTKPKEPEPKVTKPKEPEPKVTKPKEPEPKVTKPKEPEPKVTKPKEPEPKVTKPKEPAPKVTKATTPAPKHVSDDEDEEDEDDDDAPTQVRKGPVKSMAPSKPMQKLALPKPSGSLSLPLVQEVSEDEDEDDDEDDSVERRTDGDETEEDGDE